MSQTDDQTRNNRSRNAPNNEDRVGTDTPHEGLAAGEAAGAGGLMGGPTDGVNEVATATAAGIAPEGGEETEDAHSGMDSLAGTSRAKQG